MFSGLFQRQPGSIFSIILRNSRANFFTADKRNENLKYDHDRRWTIFRSKTIKKGPAVGSESRNSISEICDRRFTPSNVNMEHLSLHIRTFATWGHFDTFINPYFSSPFNLFLFTSFYSNKTGKSHLKIEPTLYNINGFNNSSDNNRKFKTIRKTLSFIFFVKTI